MRGRGVGLRLAVRLLWWIENVAQAANLGDELLLDRPFGFEAGELLLQRRDSGVNRSDRFLILRA